MTTRRQDRMIGHWVLMIGWILVFVIRQATGDILAGIEFGGIFMIWGLYPIIASFQENRAGDERQD